MEPRSTASLAPTRSRKRMSSFNRKHLSTGSVNLRSTLLNSQSATRLPFQFASYKNAAAPGFPKFIESGKLLAQFAVTLCQLKINTAVEVFPH